MTRDTVATHDATHAGHASAVAGAHIESASHRPTEVVEIELATTDRSSTQPSRQAMLAAFRAERLRAASTPEPERVIEDLVAREGEGSLRQALVVTPSDR